MCESHSVPISTGPPISLNHIQTLTACPKTRPGFALCRKGATSTLRRSMVEGNKDPIPRVLASDSRLVDFWDSNPHTWLAYAESYFRRARI